jgi:AcrR family transcriptional regulator
VPKLIDHQVRKEALAQAVWDVILERGVAAVSVRTVAARANLAVGSLRHVFPTRNELMVYSAELMLRRAEHRIRALPPADNPIQHALDVLRELLPLTPDTQAELQVNIALFAEAPAVPALVGVRDRTEQALSGLYARLVAQVAPGLNVADSRKAADRLGALTDGLALRLLASQSLSPTQALDLLKEELEAIAAAGLESLGR